MISDFKFRVRRSDIKDARMMIIEDFQQIGDWRDMAQCLENCGQFTGLHDKNGKDIYEGDKLRDDYYDEDTVIEDYAVVVWDGKLCQWAIDNSFAQDGSSYTNLVEYFGRENLEIIGNVFENADLVKL